MPSQRMHHGIRTQPELGADLGMRGAGFPPREHRRVPLVDHGPPRHRPAALRARHAGPFRWFALDFHSL